MIKYAYAKKSVGFVNPQDQLVASWSMRNFDGMLNQPAHSLMHAVNRPGNPTTFVSELSFPQTRNIGCRRLNQIFPFRKNCQPFQNLSQGPQFVEDTQQTSPWIPKILHSMASVKQPMLPSCKTGKFFRSCCKTLVSERGSLRSAPYWWSS